MTDRLTTAGESNRGLEVGLGHAGGPPLTTPATGHPSRRQGNCAARALAGTAPKASRRLTRRVSDAVQGHHAVPGAAQLHVLGVL